MQRFILKPWDCVSTPSPGTVLLQSQPSCLWSNCGAENKVNNSTWTWTCRYRKLQKLHSNRKFSIKQSTYQVQVGYSLSETAGSSPTLQRVFVLRYLQRETLICCLYSSMSTDDEVWKLSPVLLKGAKTVSGNLTSLQPIEASNLVAQSPWFKIVLTTGC